MSDSILITGATGFIGRQLTRDLIEAGERVRILARDERKARALFGNDVEFCPGDLDDAASVLRASRDTEVIYHIGGIYRFGLRHRRELWRVNVEGTENVLRAAAQSGTDKVVHLSSGGLFRKHPGAPAYSTLLNENDYPIHAPSFSPYKYSKWHSEQRALAWARKGLPVVIASTTCPIGSGDAGPTPTGQMIRDFLDRRFPFYCRTSLNFIDVRDLSEGLQAVARNGQRGSRYLLCNENLWLKQFLDLLSKETDLPSPRRCLPNWTIQMAGCGGEVADFLNPRSTGARVCLETAQQARKVQFFDNTQTKKALAWSPTRSIRESIREAVAWFRNEEEAPASFYTSPQLESSIR